MARNLVGVSGGVRKGPDLQSKWNRSGAKTPAFVFALALKIIRIYDIMIFTLREELFL